MTWQSQSENAVNLTYDDDLPQVIESYDVTTKAQLYSGGVAKKSKPKREPALGRDLWDGGRIREIRDDRRLSQEALAELSGVSEGDISRHERNDDLSNPAIATLVRLALALKVPKTALLEPVGSFIPRPEESTGHGERSTGDKGAGVLEDIRLQQLDAETPAEDSTRGDILKAQAALATANAALNRALRRPDSKSGAA